MGEPERARLTEARVRVGDIELNFAEATTLRVAVEMMRSNLAEPTSLGTDQHGARMRENYLHHLGRIARLIHKSASAPNAIEVES